MTQRHHIAMLGLLLVTAACYWQVSGQDFVLFDDPDYVYANPHVTSGLTVAGIKWAFTAFHASNWHPLTWISHMVDVQLFGMNAGAMKLHNVALHLINTWLVFWIIASFSERTAGAGGAPSVQPLRGDQQHHHHWCAVLCAAVFALHPLHVESVAWVSERKDVLSTAFGFAALLVWIHHTRRPSAMRYAATLALFAASLMSKPMFVTLPCVMLLIDWWFPRRAKLRWVIVEKLPMFALVAASCVLTYMAQHAGGAVAKLERLPLESRIGHAATSYVMYLQKTLYPGHLTVYYPLNHAPSPTEAAGAAGLLLVITVGCVALRRKWPHLLVGWLWYLGTLVPVIGIVQVGGQSHADRYMYVPMVGLLIMLAWSVRPIAGKPAVIAAACAVLVTFAATTSLQLVHWRDSISLFSHAVRHTDRNWRMLGNLGHALIRDGRYDDAIGPLEQALAVRPAFNAARINLGNAHYRAGRVEDAIKQWREAILIEPDNRYAHLCMAIAMAASGRADEAADHARTVIAGGDRDPLGRQAAELLAGSQR